MSMSWKTHVKLLCFPWAFQVESPADIYLLQFIFFTSQQKSKPVMTLCVINQLVHQSHLRFLENFLYECDWYDKK